MAKDGFISLPSIRQKILRSFFLLVSGYAVLGVFLILAVFLASRMTPALIQFNYDSIAAASLMKDSWVSLSHRHYVSRDEAKTLMAQFEQAITFEEKNADDADEKNVTSEIRKLWEYARQDLGRISKADADRMENLITALVVVNERGMFNIADESYRFSRRVLFGSIILFVTALMISVYIADGLATRLARPIKDMAERIKSRPLLGQKLKLPQSDSLEMRILTQELAGLWERLSDFTKLNVEEIKTQQKNLHTVLESIEDAVLVLDTEGRVVHANDGMLRLINLNSGAVNGQVWNDLSTMDENYLKLRSLLVPEMSKHKTIQLSFEGETRVYSGRYRDIRGATPLSTWGVIYLLHDITEIRQREHMKAEFLGTLANDMRAPLEKLSVATEELVEHRAEIEKGLQNSLDRVQEYVVRIRAIASDFMQVSLIDMHSLRLRMERMPVSDMLRIWIKPFQIVAKDKEIRIVFEVNSTETIWANIDVVKFPWVISNLLSSSIRVSPRNSEIRVVVTDKRGIADIEICDEAEVPEDVQCRLLEPYFEGARDAEGDVKGYLGLGLVIAKEVVEAHGGVIDYFARQPKGSTFRVALPLAEPV
jgi:signal transduction histidine kinase